MNTENSTSSSSDVTVQCEAVDPPSWISDYERFLHEVLRLQELYDWELSVILTNNVTIRAYNRDYRKIDQSTDVLSFSQSEGEGVPAVPGKGNIVGDLMISLEAVRENAEQFQVDPLDELRRVSIHGILHLSGYQHATTDTDAEPMLRLQEQILQSIDKELLF